MKKVKIKDVHSSVWFTVGGNIFFLTEQKNTFAVSPYENLHYNFSSGDDEVNLDWWECIAGDQNAPLWLIMKAAANGAEIEYRNNAGAWISMCIFPRTLFDSYTIYRVKKTVHTISIDGKEIELSTESYNNLKESLK